MRAAAAISIIACGAILCAALSSAPLRIPQVIAIVENWGSRGFHAVIVNNLSFPLGL